MEVYIGKREMEKVFQELEEWIRNREERIRTIVGEHFNARIERKGEGVVGKEEEIKEMEEGKRHSKNIKMIRRAKDW